MPWGGTAPNQSFTRTDGTRTGDDAWAQAKAAGIKITTDGHDTHDTDFKDGINSCLKKDGGNTATADIPMGGFTLTNIDAAGARTEPARFSDVQDGKGTYVATVGGTADVITLTPTIPITAYAAGQRFQFIASGTNTGAVTVNVSSVGAKDVKNRDATFTSLSAGAIVSGTLVDIEYDGTRFQLMSASASVADGDKGDITVSASGATWTIDNLAVTTGKINDLAVSTAKIAADAVTYAKIQNVSAESKILGRGAGSGSGDVEELSLGSGLSMSGTTLSATAPSAATQAEQETASSTSVYVSPGRQHFHPGMAKAWVNFGVTGTVNASYNINSITDNGTGDWTVNIETDFSSANYCGMVTGGRIAAAQLLVYNIAAIAAGTYQIRALDVANALADPASPAQIHAVFFGDHA